MTKYMQYVKTAVAAVVAAGIALTAALSDNSVSPSEWVTIALAVAGVLGVYRVPNTPAE